MKNYIKSFFQFLIGAFSFSYILLNTALFFIPILFLALIKLIPYEPSRKFIRKILSNITLYWVEVNNFIMNRIGAKTYQITSEKFTDISKSKSYIVTCNHQSWVDILILQYVLHKKIAPQKYFLKQQLIWVPLLGFIWWALDYPFMKRYSKQYIAKHPEKKGEDLLATRKSCLIFKQQPFSLINFPEGTRYTPVKHARQHNKFKFLLNPKAGGFAYALSTLGHNIDSLIDVTIKYSKNKPSFGDLLCGKVRNVEILVKKISIPEQFYTINYDGDPGDRESFQQWLNNIWLDKDEFLG